MVAYIKLVARRSAVVLGLAVAWPGALAAQHDEAPRPAAYALTNVTVVQADGRRTEGVTVVVRDSYIEALGTGIEPPADAKLLDGDSLVVYPGIVDADGAVDADVPAPEISWDTIRAWAPPRKVQGYTPSRRLVDHLTADGDDVDDQRKAGVVATAVHPDGDVMPGRGALLLLRRDAADPTEMVVDPVLGPTFTLDDANAYPSTLFGVIAFMRQRFEDARRQDEIEARFADSSGRLTMPAWDADLAVLRDVMDGEPRVFFQADEADDIRRVIGLADTYGFRPVIVGGQHAAETAALLTARDVPVLLSLDFPEPRRWDPDAESEESSEEEAGDEEAADTAGVGAEEAAEPEPLDAAALDEKEEIEEVYRTAAGLEAAGVTFALTSGGGDADIMEGARKAIEYGLSEAAALRAVTTTPASLYGVPQLARVEAGAPATFIVADGPLFGEDTKIAYTFVEGALEEGATSNAAGGEPPAVDVGGSWSFEISVQGQTLTGTMQLEQDGAEVEGSLTLPMGTAQIVDGVVSGSELTCTILFEQGGQSESIDMSGTIEGESASGTASGSFGTAPWTAERQSGPPSAGGVR